MFCCCLALCPGPHDPPVGGSSHGRRLLLLLLYLRRSHRQLSSQVPHAGERNRISRPTSRWPCISARLLRVRPWRTAAGAALISHAPCCTSRCSRCCCCCCCCCDVSRRRLCNSPDSLWLAVELNSRPGLRTSLNYWKGIASPLVGRQMEKKTFYQISIYVLMRRTLHPSLQFSILRGESLRIKIYQGGKTTRFDNCWNRIVSFTIFTFVAVTFRRRPPSLFLIEEKKWRSLGVTSGG